MRIVVNHLTRMEHGYICVAGIDWGTRKHVRPVLRQGQRGIRLSTNLLRRNGGPFDIACVVNLGVVEHIGRSPEVEDYLFNPERASLIRKAAPEKFWKFLRNISRNTLTDIFGEALREQGRGAAAVDFRSGDSSLGCLLLKMPPRRLRVDGYKYSYQITLNHLSEALHSIST